MSGPQPPQERRVYASPDSRRIAEKRRRRRKRRLLTQRLLALGVVIAAVLAIALVARAMTRPHPAAPRTAGATPRATRTPRPTPRPSPSVSASAPAAVDGPIDPRGDGIKMSTFLGDETRRVYGVGPAPRHLRLIWKTIIGSGKSSGPKGADVWSGTGWTGSPAIVRDGGRLYLLIGGYDHDLHKIDAATGKVAWQYAFDDIIKSSPSVIEDPHPRDPAARYIVMAGSRRGFPLAFTDPNVAPYRGVAFGTGKELWRQPVPLTASYSRDCDGSGFGLNDSEYIGVESGWFYRLDPFRTVPWNGHRSPVVKDKTLLLGDPGDAAAHAGNLVMEASASLIGDTVYIPSGSGHVYGLRRSDLKTVWDYRIGSDLNGSAVTTSTGKLLVTIDKQYIPGRGGVMLLDPSRRPKDALKWFFPTGDRKFADWEGGVTGSVAVNDSYNTDGKRPALAAFEAIDGYLYVVAQRTLSTGTVTGPNLEKGLPTPKLIAKFWIGGGISTPIIVGDSMVAAGYDDKVHLYDFEFKPVAAKAAGALRSPSGAWYTVGVHETDTFTGGGSYESTPVMWKGRVFIGSRNGYLYCLGDG